MRAGLLERALHPADVREVDAVFVLEEAAGPDRRAHAVERHANAPAFEVLRRADAGFAIIENEAVAEDARGESGNRHERTAARAEPADEFGARHFRGVELELAAHAV